MIELFKWLDGNKTRLVAIGAIISGVITMLTAYDSESGKFEPNQLNAGWTQVLGGGVGLFLRQGIKKTEEKVQENTTLTQGIDKKVDKNGVIAQKIQDQK